MGETRKNIDVAGKRREGLGDGRVRIRFVLGTAPSHVSNPPNQNGTIAKDG